MKQFLSIIFGIVFSFTIYAQSNSINYKAIIKDGNGNLVANQSLTVRFTILSNATNVYQETHTPTTNYNGTVILNIGEGTVNSGIYADIDWGSDDHFLNVQVDTGAGLVDLGTTEFMTVPYALNAANVSGLEAIDEGNGNGWRLIGRNPANYGNLGNNAIDISNSHLSSTTNGATGAYSFAVGQSTKAEGDNSNAIGIRTIASGTNSTSIGYQTIASGNYSNAIGYSTIASGEYSNAFGFWTTATGEYSTSFGRSTTALANNSVALGRFNVGGGTPDDWIETDPLFEIGNGLSSSSKSNALTVLKDGTITAPSLALGLITDDKSLITKEYADTNLISSGLEVIDEGNGIGWRLKGKDPNNYGNLGDNAVDLSHSPITSTTNGATGDKSVAFGARSTASGLNSVAMGNYTDASGISAVAIGNSTEASGDSAVSMGISTEASGDNAVAMGYFSVALGENAVAMGKNTDALGKNAAAMGNNTKASGDNAVAMGLATEVLGDNAVVMGNGTIAESYASLTLGQFNVGGGSPTEWQNSDPLFEIGNGLSSSSKSNALTVLKDGTIIAPSFDLSLITDDKSLITKEYADTNLGESGLEALNEGNGIGWRLKGQNPANYGNIGFNATDLSISNSASTTNGATGSRSTAMGNSTEASGLNSTAMGHFSIATGNNSFAAGDVTEASGNRSTALGFVTKATGLVATAMGDHTEASGLSSITMNSYTKASGNYSTAMGERTDADASHSVVLGRYNVGGGSPTVWQNADPLFEVGNGTGNATRSNALTILKDGTITAPTFDLTEITDDKALITKEYADTNLIGSGLEALDEGNGIGWRLVDKNPSNYGDIGSNAIDLSYSPIGSAVNGATGLASFAAGNLTRAVGHYSSAFGSNTEALGSYSLAVGSQSIASNSYSVAMGRQTTASGSAATAMGSATTASNIGATSMGSATIASGRSALATGRFTKAEAYSSTALGQYNIGGGDPENWSGIDPVFEIGNGLDDLNRENAVTVLKNGKVGIGEHNPDASLEILSNNSASEPTVRLVHEGTTGARINFTNTDITNGNYWTLYGDPNDVDANSVFNIYHPNAGNIVRVHGDGEVGINGAPNTDFHMYHGNNGGVSGMKLQNSSDNSWWRFYVSSGSDDLRLFSASQGTTIIGAFDDVSGTYTASSDRRLKKNFKDLHFNWEDFMKLKALTYQYKVQKDDEDHIGLIAQDVEPIYPELVNYNEDEDVFHLNYSGFGVVAIKAIQELKAEVNILSAKNKELKKLLSKYENLEARLSALETASKKENVTLIAKQ